MKLTILKSPDIEPNESRQRIEETTDSAEGAGGLLTAVLNDADLNQDTDTVDGGDGIEILVVITRR